MNKISAVINTYNAAEHLEEILGYLKAFDEVVVCDMESTDSTREIAVRNGCRVVIFPKGNITICEPARNCAIQSARNEWVLIVDADEIIPEALVRYLHDYVNSPEAGAALNIARRNLFMGNRVSAAYPDYQCRLVRKSKCDWPATIHAKPVIDGRVDSIDPNRRDLAMIHKPMKFSDYVHKRICRYTDNEVERRSASMRGNVSMLKLIFSPWFRFFKSYIVKGGIFRGKAGYIEARCDYVYKFIMLSKIYEHQLECRDKEKK